MTVKDLMRSNNRKYPTADEALAALTGLVGRRVCRWEDLPAGPKGGRPSRLCVLCLTHDETDETLPDDDDEEGGSPVPPHDDTPRPSGTPRESPGDSGVSSVSSCVRHGPKLSTNGSGAASGATGVSSGTRGDSSHAAAVVPEVRPGDDGPVDAAPSYVLVTDAANLPMVATAVEQSTLVGLDTETTGLDPRSDRVRLLSVCCDTTDGGTVTYVIDAFALPDLTPLWEALSSVSGVGHNLLFDLQFLARLGFEPGECRDTLLMSQVLYAGDRSVKSHKLADCCQRELGESVDKTEQTSDWSGVLTPDQLRYAARDADLVRRLHDALAPKLAEAGLSAAAAVENGAVPAVVWLSAAGVAFDRPGWDALSGKATAAAGRLAHLRRNFGSTYKFGGELCQGEGNLAVFYS
jgi:hypothetical protein